MEVVSTAYFPRIVVSFNKRLKETKNLPDKEIDLNEFIDVKGMKTQGNQLTKLKVKDIELAHPIAGDVPWPVEEEKVKPAAPHDEQVDDEDGTYLDKDDNDIDDDPIEMEWDLTKEKKKDKPNPIKDEEDDSQTKLF
jgi:topoisomerase IV subunit A